MNKIVENYALHESIGKGVYGQVHRATHQKTKQQYAVKVISKTSFKANPRLEQLALNQISILSALRNEHIVRFVQTLKTPNNFYFVYEYCNGGTLQTLLQTKKYLKETQALIILRQLLIAFKELNKNNIMHRDLKPDNIFLSDGKIKLGDFGFCKMLEMNMAQTMLGSPIYMAPEILKEEIYTLKADIWSLGVVLFEMLFGFCPFESSSICELIDTIDTSELKIPYHVNPVSQQVAELLLKMLKKDQFKRIEWPQLLQVNISEDGYIISSQKTLSIESIQKIYCAEDIPRRSPQKKTHTEQKEENNTLNNTHRTTQHNNSAQNNQNTIQNNQNTIQPKSDAKQSKSFRDIHDRWVKAIEMMAELDFLQEEIVVHLMIVVLLKQITDAYKDNPQWTDVLIQEKKCLNQALITLKADSSIDIYSQKQELLKIWKKSNDKQKGMLAKAIKYIYDCDQTHTDVQIILLI